MNNEDFYIKCGELLQSNTVYAPFPYYRRTRWNNRVAGSGRYEGKGVIRVFSETMIHVALNEPEIRGVYNSKEAVLSLIMREINK